MVGLIFGAGKTIKSPSSPFLKFEKIIQEFDGLRRDTQFS